MMIYPTLEILDGKCVTLTRGRLAEPVLWHVDPVKTARAFADAGAEWMHVTDLNGLSGEGDNTELIEEIILAARIPVQLGGGLRTQGQVEAWLDRGVGRVVIGTMASLDPSFLHALAKFHPDQIVLAVDVYQGAVMTDGWRSRSSFAPAAFIAEFEADPLAAVIVTDVDGLIDQADASLSLITGLAGATRHPVIARSPVSSVDDVARLKYVHNVSGMMIGRALMARDVDLAEALTIAAAPAEPVADFQ